MPSRAPQTRLTIGDNTRHSLILSDMRMPGISGFEVVGQVRRANPDVKVVLISSFEIYKSEVNKLLQSTRIDDFVLKPVRTDHLVRIALKHSDTSRYCAQKLVENSESICRVLLDFFPNTQISCCTCKTYLGHTTRGSGCCLTGTLTAVEVRSDSA